MNDKVTCMRLIGRQPTQKIAPIGRSSILLLTPALPRVMYTCIIACVCMLCVNLLCVVVCCCVCARDSPKCGAFETIQILIQIRSNSTSAFKLFEHPWVPQTLQNMYIRCDSLFLGICDCFFMLTRELWRFEILLNLKSAVCGAAATSAQSPPPHTSTMSSTVTKTTHSTGAAGNGVPPAWLTSPLMCAHVCRCGARVQLVLCSCQAPG
jgi:hypothetical protein